MCAKSQPMTQHNMSRLGYFLEIGSPSAPTMSMPVTALAITASAEFASAVTGIDIVGADGEPISRKYPKRDMLCWVIGWDLAHIGQTIYRVLFEPNYFRVIPDEGKPGSF